MARGRLLRIGVDLEARFAGFEQGLRRVEGKVGGFNKRMDSAFKGASRAVDLMRSAVVGLTAALSIRQFVRYADQWTNLSARVRTVTKETGDFQRVLSRLTEIANTNGAAIEDTVEQFTRFAIVREEIGASNEQLLRFTDAFQKLGVIGGATSGQLANAGLQLSQALAGGVVRAEEFNSILENTPLFAKAIAEGFGVGVGELRKMVIEGKLFSADVLEAILKQTDRIDQEFAELGTTVERSWQAIGNQLLVALGNLNEYLGLTEKLSRALSAIISFTENLANKRAELEGRLKGLLEREKEYLDVLNNDSIINKARRKFKDYEAALEETRFQIDLVRDALANLDDQQNRTNEVVDNTVERFANWERALEDVNKELQAAAKNQEKLNKTFDKGTPVAATQAIRDLIRELNTDIDELIQDQELFGLKGEEAGRRVETQFINVTETIQNRLQPVIADFYESLFGGEALRSVRDFLNAVKDMFIRIFAEIAAKITISKIFGGLFPSIGIGGVTGGGAIAGIGGAIGGGLSKIGGAIGGLFGLGGAATGAAPVAFTAGVSPTGFAGISGLAGTQSGAAVTGGAAAPGLGIGAALGPLLGFGALAGIHAFGKSRSVEEIWRDMWNKRVLPLIESGAVEAANLIDEKLWNEVDQDGNETFEEMGRQWLFVQDRVQEFATAVETVIPGAYATVLENGGILVKTTNEQQRELVDDILDAWNNKLEPGVLTTLANIELSSFEASRAMADGWVYASELARLGIEGLGNVSADEFARMVNGAKSVAGAIGGIVGRAEEARAAVNAIPGAPNVPSVPAFAHGGQFTVTGRPGVDENLVAFRASQGETVTVDPAGGGMSKELRAIARLLREQNTVLKLRMAAA